MSDGPPRIRPVRLASSDRSNFCWKFDEIPSADGPPLTIPLFSKDRLAPEMVHRRTAKDRVGESTALDDVGPRAVSERLRDAEVGDG